MTEPLRVVIDARFRDGTSGGVQQWVIGLAAALTALDDDTEEYFFLVEPGHHRWLDPFLGDRSYILVRGRPPLVRRIAHRGRRGARALTQRTLTFLGSPSEALPAAGHRPPASIPRSDGTIEKIHADVMHFTFQKAFRTSVPSLYQPWDLQHLHLPAFFTAGQWEARESTYRAACEQARLVIAPSAWVKRDLVDQYDLAPDRIAVVNVPPVVTAYTDPSPQDIQAIVGRLGLPERFIYYPAQDWPHKNHIRLFEALAQLRADGVTVPLVCTGHFGQRRDELEQVARDLGLADEVMFLGYLQPTDIKILYHRARALVFPSLYEGWGLPIVEAFSSGLPVACSDVTSLPELVGDAALVFDPYDPAAIATAIRRLWTDDELAAGLARRGREAAGRFDWRQTALIMRAHYRRVAGSTLSDEDRSLAGQTALV